jgi:hypothetical protein
VDEELRALERSAAQGDEDARARLERARARAGLPETLDEVRRELAAALDELAAAQAVYTEGGRGDLARYLEGVFAGEPGLQVAAIYGYTPGFLDGDLIEHQQRAALLDEEDELFAGHQGQIERTRAAVRERELSEFAPLLRLLHGTDWRLVARRGASGVELELQPWECGY